MKKEDKMNSLNDLINVKNRIMISRQDLEQAKNILKNGIVLDPEETDWLDLYAAMSLMYACGYETEMIYLTKPIRPEMMRDLRPELPAQMEVAGIEFTVM